MTKRWTLLLTFAGGIVAACIALTALQSNRADATSTGEATFVPISPCRLFDTREASNVGPRSTPLGADEPHAFQVTGTNGRCTIPAEATAVALNLTAVAPTAATFLSAYPSDVDNPGTSVVNTVAEGAPTPNKIDVALSADGRLTIFNRFGTIDVVGDVMGYYRSDGVAELTARVDELSERLALLESAVPADTIEGLDARLAALEDSTVDADQDARLATLEGSTADADQEALLATLEALTQSMSLLTESEQPTVRFTGVNVQIVSGVGSTDGAVNGRGNLIVGYNENDLDDRTGSHNLIVGPRHAYTSFGGLLAGDNNTIAGTYSSVTGGAGNTASGSYSSVSGGEGNTASGIYSSVSGGSGNLATSDAASVSGGLLNQATGLISSVSGGNSNVASGDQSSVAGGGSNIASGGASSVAGGAQNTASGTLSSVAGGASNQASGYYGAVAGGYVNGADGVASSVSGGSFRTVSGQFNWRAGSLSEPN